MIYRDKFPSSLTSGEGLIRNICMLDDAPWKDVLSITDYNALEVAYNIRSGFKTLLDSIVFIPDVTLTSVIKNLYFNKWNKLWKDYNLEYNPLDAYKVNEIHSMDRRRDDTGEIAYGKTENSNGTDTGTVSSSMTGNTGESVNTYGYNSAVAVPSGNSSVQRQDTSSDTRNLSNSNTLVNSGKDNTKDNRIEHEEYTNNKNGNIGYTTPQDLLRQDIDLWFVPFFENVFRDIDSFITIQVY